MSKFSQRSIEELNTCHEDLQNLFSRVIERVDCTILDGHRDKAEQNRLFAIGKSKAVFPKSKHNSLPSLAVDVAPYPIEWNNARRFYLFAGFVIGVAFELGFDIRWGGDWNMNFQTADNKFNDLVHFEVLQ